MQNIEDSGVRTSRYEENKEVTVIGVAADRECPLRVSLAVAVGTACDIANAGVKHGVLAIAGTAADAIGITGYGNQKKQNEQANQ